MVKEDLTKKVATGTACWERGGVLGGAVQTESREPGSHSPVFQESGEGCMMRGARGRGPPQLNQGRE